MYNYATLDPLQVEFVEIAPVAELPDGERLFIEAAGRSIVIFNLAGKFYAIGDVCSHDSGPVGMGRSRNMRSFARAMAPASISAPAKPPPCRQWWISPPTRCGWSEICSRSGCRRDKERTKSKNQKSGGLHGLHFLLIAKSYQITAIFRTHHDRRPHTC